MQITNRYGLRGLWQLPAPTFLSLEITMASSHDPKLEQYDITEYVRDLNEQKLRSKSEKVDLGRSLSLIVAMGIFLVWLLGTGTSLLLGNPVPEFILLMLLPFLAIFALAFVFDRVAQSTEEDLEFAFGEVQQGKVLVRDKTEGAKEYTKWWVQVRGYNRRNQLRTAWHQVDAGGWEDGTYAVGTYHNFRELEEQ